MSTELQDELFTVQPRPRPALAGEYLFPGLVAPGLLRLGQDITDDGQVRGRDRCEGKGRVEYLEGREVEVTDVGLDLAVQGIVAPGKSHQRGAERGLAVGIAQAVPRRLHVVPDGGDDEGRSIGRLLRHHKILPSPRATGVASDSQGFHYSTIHGC